ncbi:hypothetical protein [Azohydromonas lata]|uniref:Uncharacterized protein n=1 Tax=Azohydromonas lata TaxID=45677 RepID=A0ABU5I9J2_9BURK|nr:hypothetical protein [Azohydromonas lata]MDZ5455633.1 hypothetical protein [Azohydromonas lata]
MRPALRPHLNRLIARLMCWVLLFGWLAGAANACILQMPLAATAAHAAAHEHAATAAGHHHHHDAATGAAHDDHGHDDEAPLGQPACKSLCDAEQSAVVKNSSGDTPGTLALATVATGACVILPAAVVMRVPRPDSGALPAPPPIPIAFLRLTI